MPSIMDLQDLSTSLNASIPLTGTLRTGLEELGFTTGESPCFDTLSVGVPAGTAEELFASAQAKGINLRAIDSTHIGISLDETTTSADVEEILQIFGAQTNLESVPVEVDLAPALPNRFATEESLPNTSCVQ